MSAMPSSDQEPPALRVEIVEDDGDWSALPDKDTAIEDAVRAVAADIEGSEPSRLVVVALSSDAQVAALNGRYRGKDKATNVLSFPAGPGSSPGDLGDIVLAIETLEREAHEQGVPLRHHVQHLVVHGILHLLGHDHLATPDAERMEAIEIEVLSRLGVANPYADAPDAGTGG